MPGSVLSSLTSTRPPSSTKKSTRASPAQPTRRNVCDRQPAHLGRGSLRDRRGHAQLDAAVGVLGLVVVPLGALEQYHLARHRRLGLVEPHHGALDLGAGAERLARSRARRARTRPRAPRASSEASRTLAIPTDEPSRAGLTNSGSPSGASSARTASGSARQRASRTPA